MKRFLIIQTAFIGDVILATSVLEKLNEFYPDSNIDFLLRKGNEGLLKNHPTINSLLVWDKKNNKFKNLKKIIHQVKANNYDVVINLHRFVSSGLITTFSGAKETRGFKKNPLSFFFGKKYTHQIGDGTHETTRNHQLIEDLTDNVPAKLKLYPTKKDYEQVSSYKNKNYICLAPTSVWFTKQLPKEQWIKLIQKTDSKTTIYLLGGPDDYSQSEEIKNLAQQENIINLSGKLSFLESAALMETAQMNHVNDSAPLHIASAMNAPVTAYFCSTLPAFGFTPLSDNSKIVEVKETLKCRPCGLHGKRECPEGHFNCAFKIKI